jgi:transcriptional regulator with XRE-family HTH domain
MAAGLTQEALAEPSNLSARAISDLERGIYRTPRYDTLATLTSALDLSQEQRAMTREEAITYALAEAAA